MKPTQQKTVRVLSAQGVKARVVATTTTAPRTVVGALKCCCSDS